MQKLKEAHPGKAILIVGDMNVAHNDIDFYRSRHDLLTPSTTITERKGFK